MAIKEKLDYNRAEDKFYGLQNVGPNTTIDTTLANKMLCFVIHGISVRYTIPVEYVFHRKLNAEDFYQLTLKVLQQLYDCGFKVLRIVTDNHKSNVGLFKKIGNKKLVTRTIDPVDPTIPLFLSFDYCHVIKNARSIFIDHDMKSEDGIISSEYLKQLYAPSNFEKMNVRRAVEIFSPPVTAAIKYLARFQNSRYDFKLSSATITYMEMMYKFFQIHDVSDREQYIKQINQNCATFMNINDERLTWMTETLPTYIDSIQRCSKDNNMQGLTKETAEALKFTAESTSKCIKYLLDETQFYYILTRSFSSDAIESMFSQVRMKCGAQDAVDARAAHHTIKRILQCGLVKTATSANVYSDCSYYSNVGQITTANTENVTTDENIQLPEYILEEIEELSQISEPHLDYGITSASIAFLAGYVVRTIQERVQCNACLSGLATSSCCNPLLGLINYQDNGDLKYPTRNFTSNLQTL